MPVEPHPHTEIYNRAIPHSLCQLCNYWEIKYPSTPWYYAWREV